MNCTRFDELHEASVAAPAESATVSGAADARAEMDAHLAECPACRARLQNYVITTQALRALGALEDLASPPPLAEPLVQRILGAVRAARTSATRGMASA